MRKKIIWWLVIFLLLFNLRSLYAENLRYQVAYVPGPNAQSVEEMQKSLAELHTLWMTYLPELPLKIKKLYLLEGETIPGITDKKNFRKAFTFYRLYALFEVLGILKRTVPLVAWLPPLQTEEYRYLAGLAFYRSYRNDKKPIKPFAIVHAMQWSDHTPPRLRQWAAAVVAAHELGHIYGADHVEGVCVMNATAGAYVDTYDHDIPFCTESVNMIKSFVRRMNCRLIGKLRARIRAAKTKGDRKLFKRLKKRLRILRKKLYTGK